MAPRAPHLSPLFFLWHASLGDVLERLCCCMTDTYFTVANDVAQR